MYEQVEAPLRSKQARFIALVDAPSAFLAAKARRCLPSIVSDSPGPLAKIAKAGGIRQSAVKPSLHSIRLTSYE